MIKVKPDFAATSLYDMIPQKEIHRFDISGSRHYIEKKLGAKAYKSVTTFDNDYLNNSGLQYWSEDFIDTYGKQARDRYVGERANYGTYLHIRFQDLLLGREIDLDYNHVVEELREYAQKNKVYMNVDKEAKTYCQDMLSLIYWKEKFEPEVVGIEVPVISDELQLSGTIDLIAYINDIDNMYKANAKDPFGLKIKKDEPRPKKKLSILDLKSGRKGFFPSAQYQLELYRQIWNSLIKDQKYHIQDSIYNVGPANWTKTMPKFNCKKQYSSWISQRISLILPLHKFDLQKRAETNVTQISGLYDGTQSISEFITEEKPSERFINRLMKESE